MRYRPKNKLHDGQRWLLPYSKGQSIAEFPSGRYRHHHPVDNWRPPYSGASGLVNIVDRNRAKVLSQEAVVYKTI